jgi:hypothetical protein
LLVLAACGGDRTLTSYRDMAVGWESSVDLFFGPSGCIPTDDDVFVLVGFKRWRAVRPGFAAFRCQSGALEAVVHEIDFLQLETPAVRVGEPVTVRVRARSAEGIELETTGIPVAWKLGGTIERYSPPRERDTHFAFDLVLPSDPRAIEVTGAHAGAGFVRVELGGHTAHRVLAVP